MGPGVPLRSWVTFIRYLSNLQVLVQELTDTQNGHKLASLLQSDFWLR